MPCWWRRSVRGSAHCPSRRVVPGGMHRRDTNMPATTSQLAACFGVTSQLAASFGITCSVNATDSATITSHLATFCTSSLATATAIANCTLATTTASRAVHRRPKLQRCLQLRWLEWLCMPRWWLGYHWAIARCPSRRVVPGGMHRRDTSMSTTCSQPAASSASSRPVHGRPKLHRHLHLRWLEWLHMPYWWRRSVWGSAHCPSRRVVPGGMHRRDTIVPGSMS